jgi:hypothetical protein
LDHWPQHRRDLRSLISAGISLYSAHFAALQYENAKAVRQDARVAAQKQAEDLERSRKAAERGATAAAELAETTRQSVALASRNADLSRRIVLDQAAALDFQQRPILVLDHVGLNQRPPENDSVTLTLVNAGKTPAYDLNARVEYVYGSIQSKDSGGPVSHGLPAPISTQRFRRASRWTCPLV